MSVYVDDLLLAGVSHNVVACFADCLKSRFKTKDLGAPKRLLGFTLSEIPEGLHLSGSANSFRPDISYAVSVLSQFTNNPSEDHWRGVKRIFRYLNGTRLCILSY